MSAGYTETAVVFIDVDGVLNTTGELDDADCFYPYGCETVMRENCLVLSKRLLDRFAACVSIWDVQLVLSTSWRLDAQAREVLVKAFIAVGIDPARVIGDTPDLSQTSEGVYPAGVRVDEIASWLDCHGNPPWVAIDDMPMASEQAEMHRTVSMMPGHFANTDADTGLHEDLVQIVGDLLHRQRLHRH